MARSPTMPAAFYSRFGAARDVLSLGNLPVPTPKHGEVLVRVKASGVNPHDTKKRSGWLGVTMPREVIVPHGDGAGFIEACGDGVDRALGERVFVYSAGAARPGEGTAAGYVAVPAGNAVPLPVGTSFAEGASLGVPAMTAFYATLGDGPVTGQTVLVHGGAGAVGAIAAELAHWNGATVIATVSSDEKAAIAKAAGADHTIDYQREDVVARVREFTAGRGVDRIVEVDLGANMMVDAGCLKPNGVVASYSSTRDRTPTLPYYAFALKGARLHFVQSGTVSQGLADRASETITTLLKRGQLRPRIAGQFSLNQIAEAHELMEAGTALGNIVINID